MSFLYTKNKIYTFILLIVPSLIALSWINNYFGNYTYAVDNYILTHVMPAMVVSYIVSLITAEYLNTLYEYSYARVLFTLVSLTGTLFLLSYVLTLFGFDAFFLTAKIPGELAPNTQIILGIKASDPFEAASKVYSFQLVLAMILIVVFYTIATYLFKIKKTEVMIEDAPSIKPAKKSRLMRKKRKA